MWFFSSKTSNLAPFRQTHLEQNLHRICPSVALVRASSLFFVQMLREQTSDQTQSALASILNADITSIDALKDAVLTGPNTTTALIVVPRLGTRSPWSSKAGALLTSVGQAISRIERGEVYVLSGWPQDAQRARALKQLVHDPMTQSVITDISALQHVFDIPARRALQTVAIADLEQYNTACSLALSPEERTYLRDFYSAQNRSPSDAELMMFAQANSEHCRHKIFNARWTIDGISQEQSLFSMIRHTHAKTPAHTLSAYHDNAAVVQGKNARCFKISAQTQEYQYDLESATAFQIKVETHNHPTAIAPFPGAATGAGGEIRDECATGRGGQAKAGLSGFTVSHLRIPSLIQPWEYHRNINPRMASAFEIMKEGPIGAAAFNNEFGRPNLTGYFRSFEARQDAWLTRGYDKPIMLAGGIGQIDTRHISKNSLHDGDIVIVLGGPAMLIGLGGGAASSLSSGQSDEKIDFASVQRENPEMQRRCQEVIRQCTALGEDNPICSVHDVGAGGLSNAVPELLHDSRCGGIIELSAILTEDLALSPAELWCNEAQERFVLGISKQNLERFTQICQRERCPMAVIGHATQDQRLIVGYNVSEIITGQASAQPAEIAIDLPMDMLFGKLPQLHRQAKRIAPPVWPKPDLDTIDWHSAGLRVLAHPTVASKNFLVTIGDRSVGGCTARDQMVGPWQLPVADCAITTAGFMTSAGEAMAIGERAPLALIDAAASSRMAVGEAITNLCAAPFSAMDTIKLSANWMAAVNHPGEDVLLVDAVRAVALDLCPDLHLSIPVGKDSLSMQAQWHPGSQDDLMHKTVSPVSLVVSAFAPVDDVREQWTPLLQKHEQDTQLWLLCAARRHDRLGGSILSQVHTGTSAVSAIGGDCPNVDDSSDLRKFVEFMLAARRAGIVLAYHDRSDGGAFATLAEMAFVSHVGLDIQVGHCPGHRLAFLFNEELGAVVQVTKANTPVFLALVAEYGLQELAFPIAQITDRPALRLFEHDTLLAHWSWEDAFDQWWSVTLAMQKQRDNPLCAEQEWQAAREFSAPGMQPRMHASKHTPASKTHSRPHVAILREQGVNSQFEMAHAFDRAGFRCIDVHMTDLISGKTQLKDFDILAACGGFSYGDVLGAGRGWAISILEHADLRQQFAEFFARSDTLSLGVCNGCQMLSHLKEIIPGAARWPAFVRNRSQQFEARMAMVEVYESPSVFLKGMQGARLPIIVSHGEGQVCYASPDDITHAKVVLRYIDPYGKPTEHYPYNPNGSLEGITGICSDDGRVTLLMPHPERSARLESLSWYPHHWPAHLESPWMEMFHAARRWCA